MTSTSAVDSLRRSLESDRAKLAASRDRLARAPAPTAKALAAACTSAEELDEYEAARARYERIREIRGTADGLEAARADERDAHARRAAALASLHAAGRLVNRAKAATESAVAEAAARQAYSAGKTASIAAAEASAALDEVVRLLPDGLRSRWTAATNSLDQAKGIIERTGKQLAELPQHERILTNRVRACGLPGAPEGLEELAAATKAELDALPAHREALETQLNAATKAAEDALSERKRVWAEVMAL